MINFEDILNMNNNVNEIDETIQVEMLDGK